MSVRRWLSVGLLLAAVAVGGKGVWLYAKAQLAQVLLERAWQETLAEPAGAGPARPWPWADTYPVARIEAPRLGVERIVLDGSSGRTMAFGPGHVIGTALPGEDGNSVVGGHRDTHLAFLRRLRLGDELVVERADGVRRRYRIDLLEVVDRGDLGVLADTGAARLTLVTCYPFDAVVPGGPLRYVAGAALVPDGSAVSGPLA
ncbi:MAG: class GN sortase [Acidobacteria bacterium]|nr:class GN sortase [Acidobacteriota bacterium]